MSALPADIQERLAEEYPGETFFEATRLVESLDFEPRVLRSVVFLGGGCYDDLLRFSRCAEADWRDVVFWAEYEEHESKHPRRVRFMQEPFARA